MEKLPRIDSVAAELPSTLRVVWTDGRRTAVDLAGWIWSGRELLAPLLDPSTFLSARVDDYGASVAWGEHDDLRIDAVHLAEIGTEQQPFGKDDLAAWQRAAGLSNQEAADFLGVALSTWHLYKTGGGIPQSVALACRQSLRDPLAFHALVRPRKAGRPRREIVA